MGALFCKKSCHEKAKRGKQRFAFFVSPFILQRMLVFSPGGFAAPYMPLSFVFVQNKPNLCIEPRITLLQSLGQIFVNC